MIDICQAATISVRPHDIEDFLHRLLITARRGNHLDGALLACRSKHTNGKAACECANQLGHAPILDKIVEAPQRELHLAVRLELLRIRNNLVERRIRMRRKVPIDKADNDLEFCARSSRIKDVDVFAHNLTAVLSSIFVHNEIAAHLSRVVASRKIGGKRHDDDVIGQAEQISPFASARACRTRCRCLRMDSLVQLAHIQVGVIGVLLPSHVKRERRECIGAIGGDGRIVTQVATRVSDNGPSHEGSFRSIYRDQSIYLLK
ncbi:Uncharacterised protein [Collinsella intestinalis]|nr:Uncharacterised protein [Collinsella intestinalis]